MARWLAEDDELTAYRGDGRHLFCLMHASTTVEEDWRSHYEKKKKPRHAEIVNAMDHMGLSMWDAIEPLGELSRQFPKQLGTFVVRVELDGALGIWFAETGPEGHYTVWGRPADLQRSASLPGLPV